jgi:hypothetical protein
VFLANPLVVNGGQTRFTSIVYRIATLSSPVADLAFNLSDGKLYVLTTDGNLYRSTNNALTWTAGGVQPFPEFALVASGITGTKLVCSGGYLFVLHGATITKYDTSGAVVLYWSTGLSTTGGDLVVTPTGNIAVAADSTTEYHDSGEIHDYDTVGGLLKTCTFTKSRNAAAPPTVTYQLCVDRTGQMLIQYTGPTWMEEVEDGTKTVSVCTYYWNGVVTSLSLSARLTYGVFYAHGQIPAALAFAASSTHLYLAGIDDTNTMICAYDGTIQTEMGGAPSLLSSPTDSWLSYYTSLDASAAATNFTADLKNLVALGNKVAGSAGSDLFLMQTPDVALSVTLTVTKQNGQIVTLKPTATATDGSAPIRTFVTCGDGTTLDNLTLGATVEHTFALGTYGMQAHCVEQGIGQPRFRRRAQCMAAALREYRQRVVVGLEAAAGCTDRVGDDQVDLLVAQLGERVMLQIMRLGGEPDHQARPRPLCGDVGQDVGRAHQLQLPRCAARGFLDLVD